MSWKKTRVSSTSPGRAKAMARATINSSPRKLFLSIAVLSLAAIGLIVGAQFNSTDAMTAASTNTISAISPSGTFAGTNTGAIPDGLSGTPPQFGAPRDINFAVSGITGNVTDVSVNFTATHSWVGDVEMVLMAPGGSPSLHLASRIGVTTAGSFGDSSNFAATYTFADTAAGSNIWTVATAAACGDTCTVTAGNYRTVAPGQTGQTNPAPVTSLNTTFSGLTPAQANGTWVLRFRDAASADTGSVTAANLTVNPTVPNADDAPVDMNGDGKTDFVVVRNTGGGPTGQITWFVSLNGFGFYGAAWGIATDFFVPEDYDGDNKTDIAVWRPSTGTWYIQNSTNNTARVEQFGQSGDDPTVVGDYNGDGSADLAVYRGGAAAGNPSTWFYRSAPNGAVTYVPWGMNGDFPAPGDYDGDGKNDFVIQRPDPTFTFTARFWRLFATGATDTQVFRTPNETIVPGDYDGDDKTDIATVSNIGGSIHWFWRPSSGGPDVQHQIFGLSATDYPVQGDYDGDGTTDLAVWRPALDPTQNFFYWKNSSTGTVAQAEWGQNGDYPVANYNAH